MAQYAMPLVMINMGGEMVYILAQRLTAQNVPLDKSKRGTHASRVSDMGGLGAERRHSASCHAPLHMPGHSTHAE